MGEVMAAEVLGLLTIRLLAVGFYDSRVVFYHFSRSVEEYRDVTLSLQTDCCFWHIPICLHRY